MLLGRRRCRSWVVYTVGILCGFAVLAFTEAQDSSEIPEAGAPSGISSSGPKAEVESRATSSGSGGAVTVAGGVIRYELAAEGLEVPRQKLVDWIERSAFAVANYYGRFPVDELSLLLVPVPGKGVKTGKAYGSKPPTINIFIGLHSGEADLKEDWIMVHEMVHLAFPSMPSQHHWIEEGLATYVESIARASVGDLTPEFVWAGFVRGMPHGLPGAGDKGLDYTPTWGRTYWGGALFCLLADIELREKTDNRLGLQDALSAIIHSGANITRRMTIGETLRIGDEAVGLRVLTNLYQRMKGTPVDVDLDALWRRLGITVRGEGTVFNERAALASVRKRITAVSHSALHVEH